MRVGILWGVVLVLATLGAQAAGLGSRIAGDDGGWAVMRSTDMMTDKPDCIAIYKGDARIQGGFNESGTEYLYVSGRGRGGVQAFRYRIDDGSPSGLEFPTETEKKISAFDLGKRVHLSDAKRIRVQVSTVLSSTFDADIDMTSFEKVLPVLQGPLCHG